MSDKQDSISLRYAHRVERTVLWSLLALLLLVAVLATIQLAIDLVGIVLTTDGQVFLHPDELFGVFEAFFLVLIAVELLETVRMYLQDNVIHVEVVVLVALTAVARKIIVLHVEDYDPVAIIGVAGLAVALGAAYYFIHLGMGRHEHEDVEAP